MGTHKLKTLGATNLAVDKDRSKLDYYGTDKKSTRSLLDNEFFTSPIWEPSAGHHLIADVLEEYCYAVRTSDLIEYEGHKHELIDFLNYNNTWDGDIVCNPPYNLSLEFVEKGLSLLKPGRKLAAYLRMQWLEGINRYERIFKDNPPKVVYVFVNRQVCDKNDDFSGGSAIAYAWFVWEKGYKGDPIIKWLRN